MVDPDMRTYHHVERKTAEIRPYSGMGVACEAQGQTLQAQRSRRPLSAGGAQRWPRMADELPHPRQTENHTFGRWPELLLGEARERLLDPRLLAKGIATPAAVCMKVDGHPEVSTRILEIANDYPEKALLRRRIAHSKCAGVRKSVPSRIVFLPFEREGPPGNLAVEIIHLSKFIEAAKWAEQVHEYLMQHVDGTNFFKD